jgi:KipI family sensor histidine kinase inhibitor
VVYAAIPRHLPSRRISAYGESALLVELDDLASVHRAYAALRSEHVPGVLDLVPAARTLLVVVDPGAAVDVARIERTVVAASEARTVVDTGPLVEIPTVYDGEDLAEVADLTGLTVDEVVARHSQGEYLAAFCGFVPGFAYLTGLDERLHVPRLPSPRVRVPAGSVAIADQFTAVYPRQSPGGWRLIGHTSLQLFDVERDDPALLSPATRVRFRPVQP